VRIAESLAKMRLATFATESDVDEALRLFQVSTLDAAMTGSLAGMVVRVIKFTSAFYLSQLSYDFWFIYPIWTLELY